MKKITEPDKLQKWCEARRKAGAKIALVPTMGYLHEGHLSLIEAAKKTGADEIVVSVYVNPAQFGPKEDFSRYPRDPKNDEAKCKKAGVSVLFMPTDEVMYQKHHSVFIDEKELGKSLCGGRRPGHFRGVCTVVAKLFNLVQPHVAIFGQKDYQQVQIVKRMVRDLNFNVKIVMAPIIRDEGGMALSSRNAYLPKDARENALSVSAALAQAQADVKAKKRIAWAPYRTQIVRNLRLKGLNVDYVELVEQETLKPVEVLEKGVVMLIAVYAAGTRLIDNAIIQ